jgi:hypothetical protein
MNIREIFNEIIANDLLEDRREYSREDLMSAYGMNEDQAEHLYWLIQSEINK